MFVSDHNVSEISDNKGSAFYCETNQLLGGLVDFYAYAYVEDITDYEIILDGERIEIT